MGHYIDWNDVEGHVDSSVAQPRGGTVDLAKVEKGIEWAEEKFDGGLRERYEVPFTEAVSPNAYAVAQKVTSRWAAAWYLINARQSEKEDERATWYADRLLAAGDELYEQFDEGKPPDDTPATDDDYSKLPDDGYGDLSATDQADLAPVFKRAHLPGRSNPW